MPSPEFAASLRQSLLTVAGAESASRDSSSAAPALAVPPHVISSDRRTPRTVANALTFAALSLVVISVLFGSERVVNTAQGLFGRQSNPEPSPIAIAAIAPATPTASLNRIECTSPMPDLQSMAATVNALPERRNPTIESDSPFSSEMGSPADPTTTAAVNDTVRQYFACANAGEFTRLLGLYTDALIIRSYSGVASYFPWSPSSTPEPATPRPASELGSIKTIEPVMQLPDGRASVEVTFHVGDDRTRPQTTTFVLRNDADRWRIDDATLPVAATSLDTTGSATPSPFPATPDASDASDPDIQLISNYPDRATVVSRRDPVVLRSIPRTIGEHIGRLSGPRTLIVTGPVTDSGDGIWVGVTDEVSNVFGYLSIADLLPPESLPSASAVVGVPMVATGPVLVRATPDIAVVAEAPLPADTTLTVTGETVSGGLRWLSVTSPAFTGMRWILPDTLNAAPDAIDVATPSLRLAFPPDSIVTVGSNGTTVVLRALPRTVAEPIGRIPGQREMRVAGPLTDSTDNLWLPVIDTESGIFGYVALNLIRTSVHGDGQDQLIGAAFRLGAEVRLRSVPEDPRASSSPLTPGSELVVFTTESRNGIPWLHVVVASTGVKGWIPVDLLVGTGDARPVPAPQRATVSTDEVNLRVEPGYDSAVTLRLSAGEAVVLLGSSTDIDGETWYRVVVIATGESGFVLGDSLSRETSSSS